MGDGTARTYSKQYRNSYNYIRQTDRHERGWCVWVGGCVKGPALGATVVRRTGPRVRTPSVVLFCWSVFEGRFGSGAELYCILSSAAALYPFSFLDSCFGLHSSFSDHRLACSSRGERPRRGRSSLEGVSHEAHLGTTSSPQEPLRRSPHGVAPTEWPPPREAALQN